MDCHFLLQEIFLTQGLNPHLLHWQADSLPTELPSAFLSGEFYTLYLLYDCSYHIVEEKNNLLYLSLRNLYFAQLHLSHWGYKKKKRRPPIFKGIIVKMNPTHKMIQLKLNQVIFVKCSALCLACNKCSKKMLPALVTVLTTQRCSACSESNDSFTWSLLTER